MRNLLTFAAAGSIALLSGTASAQIFQQVTTFPASSFYSEGVECADVDHDGDLDVFIGDADGYASAGAPLQNRLYINKLIETSTEWSFVDESVARLGAHTSIAKGVTTGDLNGDGWVDVIFANAFSTQPPFVYLNQGAANPGFFTFLTPAQSGMATPISSGAASLGDVDDDGDLDLVLTDAYNAGGTSRPLHLYLNNGSAFFTENAAALASPSRVSHMDVHFADVDNDWDVDVFGITKQGSAPAHFLLLNSGSGTYSDSSSLITTASGGSYEAEIGDLDGDTDLDLFFVSISGFAEAAVRNNKVPSGTLTFTQQPNLGGQDDNEITYLDYDNDGDYDILVGSLGSTEKFYRNDGNFAFVAQNAIIQTVGDSTLDCTAADLNNDGRYDVLTVQGESGNFNDKFYKNVTGTQDTLAPVVVATLAPTNAPSGASVLVKAKVRDQVLDDGVNYVTGTAEYVLLNAPSTAAITINAGNFSPSGISVPAGTKVTWTNASGVNQSVASTTTPYTYDSGAVANAGTYEHVFVKPGVYNYTSSLGGGFNGTVTVTGSSTTVSASYMGGQQYRFRLDDNSGGSAVQVCWELYFKDWPGNTRVTDGVCIPLAAGTPYCFGDGSGLPCPCFNDSPPGANSGCLHSIGTGGHLAATGTPSVSADTIALQGSTMPNSSVLYFQGTTQVNGGAGNNFGDGLRCAGGSVVRLGTKTNVGGASQYPSVGDPSVSVRGMVSPGTRNYQAWYRNAAAFCTSDTFNLTNGVSILWTP